MSSKLPPSFIRSLKDNFGLEDELFSDSASQTGFVSSVRLNPFKSSDLFPDDEVVPWCRNGRYLKTKPNFITDPLFHAGCYYVQDASSMFLEQALRTTMEDNRAIRVLDLCAAPGDKSTLISSLISPDSLLLANEIVKTRVPILTDNLNKWGPTNIFVSNNDPRDFKKLPGYFDTIIVDAPSSGSKMSGKDSQGISQWSESALQLSSERQRRILEDAYPSLKENGTLIYSTCSYSKQENEDVADWLCQELNMITVRIPLEESWGIQETLSEKKKAYGYRLSPGKLNGNALYMACFRKIDEAEETKTKRAYLPKANSKDGDLLLTWLKPDSDLIVQPLNDEQFAMQSNHFQDFDILKSKLDLKKVGIRIGKVMGKDIVPHHELALSLINSAETPRLNLTAEQAIAYLKRNEIKQSVDFQGWALVCYQEHPLGWAKVLHNRINNYFPKELKIANQ